MRLSFLVAKALLEGDFASYFASLPPAADEPEPIMLREGRFERVSRMADEERGTVTVSVLVVREVAAEAEADAQACEKWIRAYGWEPVAENGSWRIAGLDTTAPAYKETDGSGRHVRAFDDSMCATATCDGELIRWYVMVDPDYRIQCLVNDRGG